MKFALYDFLGRPKAHYLVTEESIGSATKPVPQPGHFIFVCDASGSMWGQMAALRSLVVKLLTLEEYRDADVLVSVLSFSSTNDLVTHAARVKIVDFMSPGSAALEEVSKLDTRGLTCISQGLKAIPALIKPNEVTAAVVLSDGFANDVSPGAEKREIDTIVEVLRKNAALVVNTISLGSYADFKLLAYIANACSGTCFQAPTAKEVYDVIHDTTSLIAGATTPAIDLPLGGNDYQVFVSAAARKIIGGNGTSLIVRGLRPEDDKVAYRFKRVEASEYAASTAPVCGENAPIEPVLAFAKAMISEGNINQAKYALVSTRNQTLLGKHAKALVNNAIAAMSADVEDSLFNPGGAWKTSDFTKTYGLPNASVASVLGVLGLLAEHASDIEIDLTALRNGYKKRGVKRIAGTRNPDGTITTPWVKTAFRDSGDWAKVSSFDINRNNATCNMLVTRAVNLVQADDGTVIPEVAGVKLDLKSFNNYTLVGDGVLNVGTLSIRIGNKRLFRSLVAVGVLPDVAFDPKTPYTIDLDGRPLIAYDIAFDAAMFTDLFTTVARMKVLQSILSACTKGTSEKFTDDQIAELKRHCLSTSLYFNAPTTTEYADLKQALSDGVIDTRISYKVDFGTSDILNLGELYSANAYLERRFTMAGTGVDPKKPKFDQRWPTDVSYGYKSLSARTKLNTVDDLMFPIMEDFLGLKSTGAVAGILTTLGYDAGQITNFYNAATGKVSKDTAIETFADAAKALDRAIEGIFRDRVSPLVFYVGSTGLVPDEFNARAMTADQVREKYPDLSIGKDEADGTFYLVGLGNIIVVYARAEYFSTGKVPDTLEAEAV